MDNEGKRQKLESELGCQIAALSSSYSSEAGDYHMTRLIDALILTDKFWELFSEDDLPYTRRELELIAQNRQEKRNRIIEIRKELEGLDNVVGY